MTRNAVELAGPMRIVIIGHSVVARTGLGALLATQPSIACVGQAHDGQSGTELIRRACPDVALVDIEMPDMSGLDLTRRTAHLTKVLIATFREDCHLVAGAVRAGAFGYLALQDLRADELVGAIKTVADGGTVLSPRVTPHIFNLLRDGTGQIDGAVGTRRGLTSREAQTMDLVARGLTNVEIANELCLSVKTVKNSMSTIYRRLEVKHRSAAVAAWLGVTTPAAGQ